MSEQWAGYTDASLIVGLVVAMLSLSSIGSLGP